ncbi:MAG: helix-hairpin-helix domain-containing protein [Rhodothermales bacterium]
MHRFYALQQRLAITSSESSALVFVVVLLLVGLGVRYEQGRSVPQGEAAYAALDSTFAVRTASLQPELPVEGTEAKAAPAGDEARLASAEPRTPRRPMKQGPVRMNVNTASEQLLQRLPGIGPKMAERIVEYRAAHGDFARPRDVIRVKGIGPKTFEKLAPYLFVETDQLAIAVGADGL